MVMGKYIFIMIGVLFFLWFLAPFITKRILNVGNGIGLLFSILLLCVGVFYQKLTVLTHALWLIPAGKVAILIIAVLLICVILFVLYTTGRILLALRKKPVDGSTLIVLGCKVYGTKPSLMLEERLNAAYTYLRNHPASDCVVSGGKGEDETMPEAVCMYQYLVDRGIADSRIYLEDHSENTRQNISFSCAIIDKKNLNPNIAIVSNEFHLYRAHKIAGKLGRNAGCIPARTTWWLFPTYFVREQLCIINENIRMI